MTPSFGEIDENLMRAELTPAQVADHLARREGLWRKKRAEETGASCTSLGGRGNTAFASDTAEKTGVDKRTINRATARARALGDDLGAVQGTSLDKGTELDALAKMPEPAPRRVFPDSGELLTRCFHCSPDRGVKVSAISPERANCSPIRGSKLVPRIGGINLSPRHPRARSCVPVTEMQVAITGLHC